jgi:hypothetical protein
MSIKITLLDEAVADLLHEGNGKIVFDYPAEKIWNENGVSLKRRVAEDPGFGKRVNKALQPDNLKPYIIKADSSAPVRCIDGRMRKGWIDIDPSVRRNIGPKIAGGTAHAALAHRIVDAEQMRTALEFEADISYVIQKYKEIGIGFGGHIDDHQHGWNTGCGAVDNINLILERLQRPEPQEQLRGLTHVILGDGYARAIVNEVVGRMLYLDALKPRYMPKENNDPNGEFLYKKTIVENIRREAGETAESVPTLIGKHNEVAVVLNFVKGMTFDSDAFSYDSMHDIQAFGWDIWEMYEEAARLYPYNMHKSVDVQRRAIENRMRYVTTRTLLGLATTMVLTDGSLRVVLVKNA